MLLLRMLGIVGRVLIASGLLLLAFVAYQLWGTDLHEQKAQAHLRKELAAVLDTPATLPGEGPTTLPGQTPTTAAPTVAPSKDLVPQIGGVVGELSIPKLHVKKVFILGIDLDELDQAPGHYPSTPFPGQAGNAAIAGHRTTYGAPFHNVDRLDPGDDIIVTTQQGRFTYKVTKVFIVKPYDAWVLDPDPDHPNALTLTACHPKYDLSERIIVRASLAGEPVEKLPGQDRVQRDQTSTSGTLADGTASSRATSGWGGTIGWGAVCLAIAAAAWFLARRFGRRWLVYPMAVAVFCVALFFFFENLSLVLPAGI
jgi:sortase A